VARNNSSSLFKASFKKMPFLFTNSDNKVKILLSKQIKEVFL